MSPHNSRNTPQVVSFTVGRSLRERNRVAERRVYDAASG